MKNSKCYNVLSPTGIHYLLIASFLITKSNTYYIKINSKNGFIIFLKNDYYIHKHTYSIFNICYKQTFVFINTKFDMRLLYIFIEWTKYDLTLEGKDALCIVI